MANPQAIDGPAGRMVAAAILCAAAAALLAIHWDDLFPAEAQAVDADDPFAVCFAQRAADVDKMVGDGVINAGQAESFKARAEALCRAQAGG